MTIHDAYIKAKSDSDKKILTSCTDIGDRWAFSFRSSRLFSDPIIYGGIHYYTVNKKTGEVGTLSSDPASMELIWSGTPVSLIKLGVITPKITPSNLQSKLELFIAKFFIENK